MSRWQGYAGPLFVIALSLFVGWCAWPPPRVAGETLPEDPQSQAWEHVQRGNRLFQNGQVDAAAVEYHRANLVVPDYLHARVGLARVATAWGHYSRALELYRSVMDEAPTSEVARAIGEILALGGDRRGAGEMYADAEALSRTRRGVPVRAARTGSRSPVTGPSPEARAGH